MAYGLTEIGGDLACGIFGTHGKQGNFVIEGNLPFHDHHALVNAAAASGIVPSGFHFRGLGNARLAFAGRRHGGFNKTRVAYARINGGLQFGFAVRKGIRRGGQAQFFGSQTAYALAVHGQLHGFNGRDHGGHASRFYVG